MLVTCWFTRVYVSHHQPLKVGCSRVILFVECLTDTERSQCQVVPLSASFLFLSLDFAPDIISIRLVSGALRAGWKGGVLRKWGGKEEKLETS